MAFYVVKSRNYAYNLEKIAEKASEKQKSYSTPFDRSCLELKKQKSKFYIQLVDVSERSFANQFANPEFHQLDGQENTKA